MYVPMMSIMKCQLVRLTLKLGPLQLSSRFPDQVLFFCHFLLHHMSADALKMTFLKANFKPQKQISWLMITQKLTEYWCCKWALIFCLLVGALSFFLVSFTSPFYFLPLSIDSRRQFTKRLSVQHSRYNQFLIVLSKSSAENPSWLQGSPSPSLVRTLFPLFATVSD